MLRTFETGGRVIKNHHTPNETKRDLPQVNTLSARIPIVSHLRDHFNFPASLNHSRELFWQDFTTRKG